VGYSNKLLNCIDCRKNFTFSVEEQEFHASQGFPNAPRRCPSCRKVKKTEHTQKAEASAEYNPHSKTTPVTCARCGKATRVPFQPRNNEAVYCSDCYAKNSIGK
jgi:CxxC-x17-CxxC domain-containing protein